MKEPDKDSARWRSASSSQRSTRTSPTPLPTRFAATRCRPEGAAGLHPEKAGARRDRAGFLTLLDDAAGDDRRRCRELHRPPHARSRAVAHAARRTRSTARVIVNRVWQYHFGRGLVANAERLRQARRDAVASRAARLARAAVRRGRLEPQEAAPADPALARPISSPRAARSPSRRG